MTAKRSARRVAVTGGAGFLGSHLCDRLLADGHQVLCIDNFATGSESNIAHLHGHPRFELIRHDITAPLRIDVEEIYNLACPASPRRYLEDPVGTLRASVLGSINVLDLARRVGAKVLQASTSEVYGDPLIHPQPERYWGNVNPIGPRACYNEGKRCAETLFFAYRGQYGLPIRVLRIFNTYGPRMLPGDGRVISNFIVQALRGEPLTVYGEGSQTRAFCFVDDLIDGMVRFMDHSTEAGQEESGPLNMGHPEAISIGDLARLVLRLTGSDAPIVHDTLPADDPAQRCPDITLARTLLNWSPNRGLEDGLMRTIQHYRKGMDGAGAE